MAQVLSGHIWLLGRSFKHLLYGPVTDCRTVLLFSSSPWAISNLEIVAFWERKESVSTKNTFTD